MGRQSRLSRKPTTGELTHSKLSDLNGPEPSLPSLPSEILDYTFSCLAGDQKTIGAIRRTCKSFCHLSSPYLITTVIFSRRIDTLKHLKEVVEHPYFHKYVTVLVYDASHYDEDRAYESSQYVEAAKRGCRPFRNPEYIKALHRDDDQYETLSAYKKQGASPRTTNQPDEYSGCLNDWLDYTRLYQNQEAMRNDEVDRNVLAHTLKILPKLRSIIYTDYRGLARPEESHEECCTRMFGNTLPPSLMQCDTSWTRSQLRDLFEILAECPQRHIYSLQIGTHQFELSRVNPFPHQNSGFTDDGYDPRGLFYMEHSVFSESLHDFTDLPPLVFRGLRRIHLPIACRWADSSPPTIQCSRQLLGVCADGLTHLTLLTSFPFCLMDDGEGCSMDLDMQPDCMAVIGSLHFSQLRALDLRGWFLPGSEFSSFLSRHAQRLRELSLLRCLTNTDSPLLTNWAGLHLQLSGVDFSTQGDLDIYFLRYSEKNPREDPATGISPSVRRWKTTGRTSLAAGPIRKRVVTMDLERRWLGGRANVIKYTSDNDNLADHIDYNESWWMRKRPVDCVRVEDDGLEASDTEGCV